MRQASCKSYCRVEIKCYNVALSTLSTLCVCVYVCVCACVRVCVCVCTYYTIQVTNLKDWPLVAKLNYNQVKLS